MSGLIIPHGARSGESNQARYIQSWASQLKGLLTFANLTPDQRSNLSGFVESEVKLVFIDKKVGPEERLDYWRSNQVSTATIESKAAWQAFLLADQAQAREWQEGIVLQNMPKGYVLDSQDCAILDQKNSEFSRTHQIDKFLTFVQQVMKPLWQRKHLVNEVHIREVDNARIQSLNKGAASI